VRCNEVRFSKRAFALDTRLKVNFNHRFHQYSFLQRRDIIYGEVNKRLDIVAKCS
jgi:hypothetical protein